jgi:hypothetical protein
LIGDAYDITMHIPDLDRLDQNRNRQKVELANTNEAFRYLALTDHIDQATLT